MRKIRFSGKAREIAIRKQKKKSEYEHARKIRRAHLKITRRWEYPRTEKAQRGRSRTKSITLPEIFDLHKNYEPIMRTMNKFRKEVDKPRYKSGLLSLNFNSIAEIGISSALVLAADIDVWQMKKGKLQSRHDEWQPHIRTLLNEMGLFELLTMPPLGKDAKAEKHGTSFVKFLSAQKADGSKARELRQRIEAAMSQKLRHEYQHAMYASLAEALLNAKQHAYQSEKNLQSHEKWWITAAYDSEEKRLTVAMYDRGQTIPGTMAKLEKWEEILSQIPLLVNNHGELIKIAMQTSVDAGTNRRIPTRTKTQQPHRGKGLRQFLDLLFLPGLEKTGKVHIISGKGYCCFAVKSRELAVQKVETVRNPMQGTLVEW